MKISKFAFKINWPLVFSDIFFSRFLFIYNSSDQLINNYGLGIDWNLHLSLNCIISFNIDNRLYLIKPWRTIPYAFDHTYLSLNEISELFLDFNQLWRYQSQKTNKSRVSIEIIPYRIVSFYRICNVEMLISIQIIPCHIVYTT